MNQQTQSKGGWIASFMIVGAVLVLGLLAGLYYLKTRQIEANVSSPVATDTKSPEEKEAIEDKVPTSDTKKDEKKQEAPAIDQPKKEETSTESGAEQDDTQPATSETLPETGPADVGVQFVALIALGMSGAAYIQSRRGL